MTRSRGGAQPLVRDGRRERRGGRAAAGVGRRAPPARRRPAGAPCRPGSAARAGRLAGPSTAASFADQVVRHHRQRLGPAGVAACGRSDRRRGCGGPGRAWRAISGPTASAHARSTGTSAPPGRSGGSAPSMSSPIASTPTILPAARQPSGSSAPRSTRSTRSAPRTPSASVGGHHGLAVLAPAAPSSARAAAGVELREDVVEQQHRRPRRASRAAARPRPAAAPAPRCAARPGCRTRAARGPARAARRRRGAGRPRSCRRSRSRGAALGQRRAQPVDGRRPRRAVAQARVVAAAAEQAQPLAEQRLRPLAEALPGLRDHGAGLGQLLVPRVEVGGAGAPGADAPQQRDPLLQRGGVHGAVRA